jgi:hypothetical protein
MTHEAMSDVNHPQASECWRLEGTRPILTTRAIETSLDLARPDLGLHDVAFNGQAIQGRLLQVTVGSGEQVTAAKSIAWQLGDCYARGRDLVATYHEPLGQPFNLQLYWRVLQPTAGASFALELMASVQTRLWEAYPWVGVRSEPEGAATLKSDQAIVFERATAPAYVEVAYPGDFSIVDGSTIRAASWRYGPQFMERGVIRRLRLRGAFFHAAPAKTAIEKLRGDLIAEEPPLTA